MGWIESLFGSSLSRRDLLKLGLFSFVPLDYNEIYNKHRPKSQPDKSDEIAKLGETTLTAVGDVCLGYDGHHIEPILEKMDDEDAFNYPFAKVREQFEGIVFCNLEGTLTKHDKKVPKRFNFKADPKYVKCLGDFDIASLANNHTMDFGEKGLEETISTLDTAKIKHIGAGTTYENSRKPAYIEKGLKIGFLGYSIVCADYVPEAYKKGFIAGCSKPDELLKDIAIDIPSAKQKSDLLVVSFHWGSEGSNYPNEMQKILAKMCIDNGANIVIGHHPHVLQGMQEYKNGLIFYSLGNFMFSGNRDPKDKDSIIAKIKLSKGGIISYEVIPVKITSQENPYQPFVLEGRERNRVLQRVSLYSKNL